MRKTLYFLLCMVALSVPFGASAQSAAAKNIRGIVTDVKSGEPLIGVSVRAPKSGAGAVTNFEGKYAINVPAQDTELEFSFVGYSKNTVKIGNQTEVNVTLAEDVKNLNEVVVVGYGTQKKKDLTGSVGVVDVKEMSKRTVATLDQALQGQIPGVEVTSNSGTPGAGITVRIRGIGTINNSEPLYVVDGMMVNDITFLNMNDVESVQVLKDASASAIYGSRGSNGVVIITTKKGDKAQNGHVTVSGYYGAQNAWRSTGVMDGPTWAYMRNEALVAAGYKPIINDPAKVSTTNWFNEAISNKNAPVYNVNISVSGANDKGDYFLSVDKFSQKGIIQKTGYDRLTFRGNASYAVKPWLKVGENLTLVKSDRQSQYEDDEWTSMLLTSFTRDPLTPVKNPDGTYTRGMFDVFNPAAMVEYTNTTYGMYRTIGNVFADITFMKGLVLRSSYSTEFTFGKSMDYAPLYYVFNMQKNDVSRLTEGNSSTFVNQWSNTLTYDNKIGEHTFSAMLGQEIYTTLYKWNGITVNNVLSDDPKSRIIDNALGKLSAVVNGAFYETKQWSALARLNYNYKERYLFTGNFRMDASSKFLGKLRRAYFPSFSLGWRISEEEFMKSVDFLSNLKLRLGWGIIGNQGSVPAYAYTTLAKSGANYAWGSGKERKVIPGYAFPGMGNPDLKWESSTTTNVGIDFGFFNSKLSGNIDYFIKNTTDMLMQVPIPGQTGIESAPYRNAASMRNKGIEVSLQYSNHDHPFWYSVGANFSKIKNEILNLGAYTYLSDGSFANSFYVNRSEIGMPMAQFYGRKTDGIFQNWDEVHAQTAQPDAAPGDIRYKLNEKGEIGFYYLGSPLPDFTYSFNVGAGYKGFDLSVMMQGVQGCEIFNGVSTYTRSSTANYNLMRDMINRWHGEGTQTDARYPRLNVRDVNNGLYSDRFIEDGSYLRVKTVQLGYNLDKRLVNKLKLENIRFYLSAQNLFTFNKYTGMDPEIGMHKDNSFDLNVDRGTYPQARTLSAGLSVTF